MFPKNVKEADSTAVRYKLHVTPSFHCSKIGIQDKDVVQGCRGNTDHLAQCTPTPTDITFSNFGGRGQIQKYKDTFGLI